MGGAQNSYESLVVGNNVSYIWSLAGNDLVLL
jgi:hypothetical protein